MISSRGMKEGAILWAVKQTTGVLVFVLIIVHLIVNHFVAPGGLLSYQDVIRYLSNPGIAAMEITFLIVVTFHAILGLRSVILDLKPSNKAISIIDKVFIIIGIGAILYGIGLTITIGTRL